MLGKLVVVVLAVLAAVYMQQPTEDVSSAEDLGTGQMFNRIAKRYDLANRFMSLGLDKGWRVGMVFLRPRRLS